MQLDKTVDMMLSDDYQDRFRAEYHQALYRRNKLQKEIKEMTSIDGEDRVVMFQWQLRVMDDYIYVLKKRAERDNISLK